MLIVHGGPPPLGLGAVALTSDLDRLALDKRQFVGVLSLVVARGVDNAVVGNAQLAN